MTESNVKGLFRGTDLIKNPTILFEVLLAGTESGVPKWRQTYEAHNNGMAMDRIDNGRVRTNTDLLAVD